MTKRLALTWEFGEDGFWVEVRISADDAAPGSLSPAPHTSRNTGTSKDRARPASAGNSASWGSRSISRTRPERSWTPPHLPLPRDGKAFIRGSGEGWERAAVATGKDPGTARVAARRTAAFHAGEAAGTA